MMTTIVAAIVLLHVVAWGVAGAAVVVLGKARTRAVWTKVRSAARGRLALAVGPGRSPVGGGR